MRFWLCFITAPTSFVKSTYLILDLQIFLDIFIFCRKCVFSITDVLILSNVTNSYLLKLHIFFQDKGMLAQGRGIQHKEINDDASEKLWLIFSYIYHFLSRDFYSISQDHLFDFISLSQIFYFLLLPIAISSNFIFSSKRKGWWHNG